MKYTEVGTYTLNYKAVDACGNETTRQRTIVVTEPQKHTVLYTDGTLIINEYDADREANITKHGAVDSIYTPLSESEPYVWNMSSQRLWENRARQITKLEFGSLTAPTNMAYWFQNCSNLASVDWTNFSGSLTTSVRALFASTAITSLTLPSMPQLTTIRYICNACQNLTSVDMSGVGANGIVDTNAAFQACYALEEVDISGLQGTVDACSNTFSNTSGGADMAITTIYANAGLDFSQATAYSNMFRGCVDLVGGGGTTYDPSFLGKNYARIDNPPNARGYFTAK